MLISNSEVNTFLTCERKHYYSFRERLAGDGKSLGKALIRGTVGHEALEGYYTAKQNGEDKHRCVGFMLELVDNNKDHYPDLESDLDHLKEVLKRYVDTYWYEPWKILEVESQHATSLLDNSTVEYGMQLDLLVEVVSGRDKGQIQVIDHKFVYDFFSDREVLMNSQLIKYLYTLRSNGINVRKGILNQIRYRELKNPLPSKMFRRSPVVASDLKQMSYMEEYRKAAKKIWELTQLTEEEHFNKTTMHLDKYTCGKCPFAPLCELHLSKSKTHDKTKEILYVRNTYADKYKEA